MIKAVIIGFSHMHVNEVALYLKENPFFSLAGISDVKTGLENIPASCYTSLWNLNNVRENYCGNYYEDYKKMLDELKPDIAFVLTENIQKVEVAYECAKRKINLCIEKPLAVSLEEAKKIEMYANEFNVEVVVNWPVVWRPYVHKMKAILDSKIVGEPLKLRYINGHTGPLGKGAKHRGVSEMVEELTDEQRGKTWWHRQSHGGGVFLDICCYGCLFSRWFMDDLGERVIASGDNLNTPFGDTADNFAAVINGKGKMSVIEGTWTTPRAVIPSGPMVIGTNGVVMCTGGAEDSPDVKAYDIYGKELDLPEFTLGKEYTNMTWHYANHIEKNMPIHPILTLKGNMEIMAILDAVIKSANCGKELNIEH